ncbi:transposase [Acetobacter tropicalis NBRC 101654]|uniref:Transposase n=2 Tax=Acetobacteraceae TaxID=433 RepID=F7VIT2_9PROT|nr:transposase [Acetobacter tropicalis NBRC 101654]
MQVKAIAHARIKTDKIDAGVLAQFQASGFLPEVWVPDAATERLRRLVARRNQIVRHRTRVKNEVHAILQVHLVPQCPHADLFNQRGRKWLTRQVLPEDERLAITRHIREIDRLGDDLAELDADIAKDTIDSADVARLLTITGVNVTVASGIVAAIGDISRFSEPQKLVSYVGLNPRVRQSCLGLAQYGRISKSGRSHVRAMLVEAAWAAAKAPGPLRAFFLRIRGKRGHQIAAVAVARKLAVLVWHMLTKKQDYHWLRPALVAAKKRQIALKSGAPSERGGGRRGSAYAYNVKELRDREMAAAQIAERTYDQMTRRWQPRRPRSGTDAANGERP